MTQTHAAPPRHPPEQTAAAAVWRKLRRRTFDLAVPFFVVAGLVVFVASPILLLVLRSLHDDDGRFVGAQNFASYFSQPGIRAATINSLLTSAAGATLAVATACLLGFALQRTRAPGRTLARQLIMLPMFAPSLLPAVALVYLFGRQGLVTTGLFGVVPGFDIGLYGATGIIMAGALTVLPGSLMMIVVALAGIDPRQDEAASLITRSPLRRFRVVLWPALAFAVMGAFTSAYLTCLTDLGGPKIVGGMTTVLPVQIYQQVVGQHNLSMGAALAVVLMVPALLCFAVQYTLDVRRRARFPGVDGRAPIPVIERRPLRDALFSLPLLLVAAVVLVVIATPVFVSFVNLWPYSLTATESDAPRFSLRHFAMEGLLPDGVSGPLLVSLKVAAASAIVGTGAVWLSAYVVERLPVSRLCRATIHLLSLMPLAMPGLVIGLAYVLLFNRPTFFGLTNPLSAAYGTAIPLIAANVVHFMGVAYLTVLTSLKQQDRSFEDAATLMSVSRPRLIARVTLPLSAGALADVALYLFVNSMCTVSAVIFLYGPGTTTAPVTVVSLDDAGEQQAAAALCTLILGINILAAGATFGLKALLARSAAR